MKKSKIVLALSSGLLLIGCQETIEMADLDQAQVTEELVYSDQRFEPITVNVSGDNARMVPTEYQVQLVKAEYITAPGSQEMGRTVVFDNKGSKKLASDFSPVAKIYGTPDMSYYIDEYRTSSSLLPADASAAIGRAAMTWDGVTCSELNMYEIGPIPVPIGVVASIFGFPSIQGVVADVENLGFMPPAFFDILAPGGSDFILAATFTLIWVDDNGDPVDTNGDGLIDSAVKEIYYNDNFTWAADGSHIDLETVSLHEMGHGLSQAHFGTGFFKKNGEVQFSPRAVMNAAYSGIQQSIGATDLGGHCSIWANWPNK